MKIRKIDLSVIVPVYNVGEKIRRCVDSILKQTYDNFELILVDDDSTDASAVLCDEYAKKDKRVSVIHINNSGPFQARKEGAKVARGDFLTFSDADDWLEPNAFETAMEVCSKKYLDIYTYAYVDENGEIEENLYPEGFYCKEEIWQKIIPRMMYDIDIGKRRLNPSLCTKYIRKELYVYITESVCSRITLGDDALVIYPAICVAKSIYISNKRLYHYMNNESSCTHKFLPENMIEIKEFQSNVTYMFKKIGIWDIMEYQVESYIRILLSMIVKDWYRIDLSAITFRVPILKIPKGSRVFIYGAGKVGKSFINELKTTKYAKIVGWADRDGEKKKVYNNVNITTPEKIKDNEFDIVLIAIWDNETAYGIKGDLVKMGIPEEKIVWEKPICVV